jgi:hypothetical protein
MSRKGKIPYQKLTRQNFKAPVDPKGTGLACSRTGITISWSFETTSRPDNRYESIITDLEYEAYFDEEESWWRLKSDDEELLCHEQGHFDIAELFARELNAKKKEVMESLKGEGSTAEEAEADLERKFSGHKRWVILEQQRRHQIYDLATDNNKNPSGQQEWSRRLEEALKGNPEALDLF